VRPLPPRQWNATTLDLSRFRNAVACESQRCRVTPSTGHRASASKEARDFAEGRPGNRSGAHLLHRVDQGLQ
jgi:hypothetical protein